MNTKHTSKLSPMKNIVLLLLLFTGMINAQIVNIPDANFKAKLISYGVDTNADGNIQQSEADSFVGGLILNNSNISDLTGIQYFTHLSSLDCRNNAVVNIDFLNNLTNLNLIDFSYNQIETVHLNFSQYFTYINLSHNNITTIISEQMLNVYEFDISYNNIVDLDLSKIRFGDLTTLSPNPLVTINIKNGVVDPSSIDSAFNIGFTPSLQFVCTDDIESFQIAQTLNNFSRPNVVVNSYCSFTPGGNYNTITGNVKFDLDNNGCDATDIVLKNIRLNINDGATFTDNGNYTFYTQAGNFDIEPVIENPTWFTFSPNNASIPFADNNNHSATQNFCVTSNGSHQDLEIVLTPIVPARPGFDAVYELVLHNKGNQFMNDWTGVLLQYDALKMSFVSSSIVNSSSGSGVLEWGYFLAPFQTQTIQVVFHINSPIDIDPVVNGDVLNFTAIFNPVSTDENPADNTFVYHQTVVGSYDPNDIICLEGDVVPPTEIGNYLHYAINFENTGTYAAENVVVKTEVDASKFDINSLQLMNANFPVDARIVANKAEFIFKNIQLPIGGHGHILLKIKTQNTLITGNTVSNRGDIFFDYNAPVDTGLANTVFQNMSNSQFVADPTVIVSPNPAADVVLVKAQHAIKSIELYDVQGRIILTQLINQKQTRLAVSHLIDGIYFVKIKTQNGTSVQKLIKN